MARTSIDDVVALHRRLTASKRERSGEETATLEGEIANIGLQNRTALRERLLSRLENLRTERQQLVADYDARVHALETELTRLAELRDARSPDEGGERLDQPARPDDEGEEPPQPSRPRTPREAPRRRRGGGK
jgi:hypothetical protein